jgi:HEAT repeat protein
VERVQILPRKEQSFSLAVDSKPLLVNFDYRSTIIKELEFDKTTDDLAYQMTRDEDVLGRVWALGQLSKRVTAAGKPEVQERIVAELSSTLTRDKFWGVRVEAATALAPVKSSRTREALIAATKDTDARVRARAVTSLASSKDPALASLYQKLLSDRSYAVIKAAATALGETKSPDAYEALTALLSLPSWRDNIRASALLGFAELRDKRAVDIAFRYAQPGNAPQARAAAVRLLGRVGGDNPKAFDFIAETAVKAFQAGDLNLATASAEALVSLGDSRGLAVIGQISQDAAVTERFKGHLRAYQELLRKVVAGGPKSDARHP